MATAQVVNRPRRRWRQFGLRTLGLLILLVAVGMALWRTLLVEHFLVKWVERQKGTATTEPALPDWLAWLPGSDQCVHITEVNLGGRRVGDDDLWRYEKLPKLRELHLMNSDVTLPAVEAFVDAKPDLDCDLAFAERIYHATLPLLHNQGFWVDDVLQAYDLAERYKLAAAEFARDPTQCRRAAYLQKLKSINQLRAALASSNQGAGDRAVSRQQLLKCAELSTQLKVNSLKYDPSELSQLTAWADKTGDELVATSLRALEEGQLSVSDAAGRLQRAAEMRLLAGNPSEELSRRIQVLKEHDEHLRRLAGWVLPRYLAVEPGGGGEGWALVMTLLLKNRAWLAASQQDEAAKLQALAQLPKWANLLRQAVDAAYEAGIVTIGHWYICHRTAWEAEVTTARVKQDGTAVAAIQRARQAILDARLRRFVDRLWTYEGGPDWGEWELSFWLCAAMTAHIEDEGLPFFQHGFRAYLKKQMP